MKFAIGDLVIEKKHVQPDTSYSIDKVVTIIDGAIVVEHHGFGFDGKTHGEVYQSPPGSRGWRSAYQRYQEEELFTLKEAEEERKRMKEAKTKLNDEFEAICWQLREKLDKAAELVGEAGALAKAHDKEFYDLKQECMPLYQALKAGGWSHSHMQC